MADERARARLARAAAGFGTERTLPTLVFLTDDFRTPDPVASACALPRGSLVILRSSCTRHRMALAEAIAPIARTRGLLWIVADEPELAVTVAADGAHFPEARIADAFRWRALRPHWLITCAAHSLGACARIRRSGADAALLAPVFPTQSHAGGRSLGPLRARFIARQSPVPVYALGGVDAESARRLAGARLAGLAAVGALVS